MLTVAFNRPSWWLVNRQMVVEELGNRLGIASLEARRDAKSLRELNLGAR